MPDEAFWVIRSNATGQRMGIAGGWTAKGATNRVNWAIVVNVKRQFVRPGPKSAENNTSGEGGRSRQKAKS